MKAKYLGLTAAAASLISLVFTADIVAAPGSGQRAVVDLSDDQMRMLDANLVDKIKAQAELTTLVEQYLLKPGKSPGDLLATLLSGGPAPVSAPAPAAVSRRVAVAPPWWNSYKLAMVYASGTDKVAVINGALFKEGDWLSLGVVVEHIDHLAGSVSLRNARQSHLISVKND